MGSGLHTGQRAVNVRALPIATIEAFFAIVSAQLLGAGDRDMKQDWIGPALALGAICLVGFVAYGKGVTEGKREVRWHLEYCLDEVSDKIECIKKVRSEYVPWTPDSVLLNDAKLPAWKRERLAKRSRTASDRGPVKPKKSSP